ncbi:MAG TPA: S8 family serine peptidase, partial [Anaerolineales bacterium]
MTDEPLRPAWSNQFSPEALRSIQTEGPIAEITRQWAWAGSRGQGVKVAVVDSGIEASHPALEGAVAGGVAVVYDERYNTRVRIEPDNPPRDLSGHATACAGIIHSLAPEAELYSVRVLGRDMRGKAVQFAGGLRWAI